MNTPLDVNLSRRDFVCRMTLLGGAAATVSLLPFSTAALADVALQWGQVPALDMGRDEALGNYPAYAEPIGYGRAHIRSVDGLGKCNDGCIAGLS